MGYLRLADRPQLVALYQLILNKPGTIIPIDKSLNDPSVLRIIYLIKYSHDFNKFTWHHNPIFWKNIGLNCGNTSPYECKVLSDSESAQKMIHDDV